MFLMPDVNTYAEYLHERQPFSHIRILHAVPDAPPVDVYANNILIARSLPYRGFTNYLRVTPGNYNVKLFVTGQIVNPVLETNITVPAGIIATAAANGRLPNISLLIIPEPKIPTQPGKVYVRFAHLSPTAPSVDIALPNGTKLFTDVEFREVTDYIPLNPGTYTLLVRPTGTNQVVLRVPNIKLLPNRFYTTYAVGLPGETPPLQMLIPLDGISYIKT